MLPGAVFLKGNSYFKRRIIETPKEEDPEEEQLLEEMENLEDSEDEWKRMRNQKSRYYSDENITVKCKNCKQYGHFSVECPNEHKRDKCILCGKETHDSSECDAKMCFKCNKVGHKAVECKETNIP